MGARAVAIFQPAAWEPLARRVLGRICSLGTRREAQRVEPGVPESPPVGRHRLGGSGSPALAPLARTTRALQRDLGWMSRVRYSASCGDKTGVWETSALPGEKVCGKERPALGGSLIPGPPDLRPRGCDWKPLEGQGRTEDLRFVFVPRSTYSSVMGRL